MPFKAIVRAETRQEEGNFEELLPIDHVHESIEIEQFSDDKEKSVEKLSEIAEENGVWDKSASPDKPKEEQKAKEESMTHTDLHTEEISDEESQVIRNGNLYNEIKKELAPKPIENSLIEVWDDVLDESSFLKDVSSGDDEEESKYPIQNKTMKVGNTMDQSISQANTSQVNKLALSATKRARSRVPMRVSIKIIYQLMNMC